ncbi:MAG: aspartate aminotransferase family protein, partial [Bacteroidales bacterium]|nr:aspartate aminotransferase family protein [Bacteroidales bacterium]
MEIQHFREWGHKIVDWIADYYGNIENYPVKSLVTPGDILKQLPDHPPVSGENMEDIFDDFQTIVLPGITHWQSPDFFAYFPANGSFPSLLAEMLTAALGAQCMIWETSPAAAELEERTMDWLRQMIGLPDIFEGVIQDTASTATLCSILSAREKLNDFRINSSGYKKGTCYRVYCSEETHSSIEKAVKIAGIGSQNLVKIPVDGSYSMDVEKLEDAIKKDLANGYC